MGPSALAAALERLKVDLGGLTFSAQYQQQPVPLEGNLLRRAWFRDYERVPVSSSGGVDGLTRVPKWSSSWSE